MSIYRQGQYSCHSKLMVLVTVESRQLPPWVANVEGLSGEPPVKFVVWQAGTRRTQPLWSKSQTSFGPMKTTSDQALTRFVDANMPNFPKTILANVCLFVCVCLCVDHCVLWTRWNVLHHSPIRISWRFCCCLPVSIQSLLQSPNSRQLHDTAMGDSQGF